MHKLTNDQIALDLQDHLTCLREGRGTLLNWSGQDLSGADLAGADLRQANLSHTNLFNADLRCADLSGANLQGADLSTALIRYADLSHADLRGATIDYVSLLNETDAWEGAKLEGVKLLRDNKVLSAADSAPIIASILAAKNITTATVSPTQKSSPNTPAP